MTPKLPAAFERALADTGLRPGARVGVACSGGADSVALLHACHRSGLRPVALHVDHGLRDSSAADARFVGDLAAALSIEHRCERVPVDADAASVEAAARAARYAALDVMAEACGLGPVATAHTLDDQAETVLLRAMRGGSVDGIAPVRGRFVRPFLGLRRDEVRSWLAAIGADWIEDPTNDDVWFERNWVRHVILPQLRDRRPGVERALATVADRHRSDRAALDGMADEAFARARVADEGVLLDAADLDGLPPAVSDRVIVRAVRSLGAEASMTDLAAFRSGATHVVMGRAGGVEVWRLSGHVAVLRAGRPAADPVRLPLGTTIDEVRGLRVRIHRGAAEPGPADWRLVLPRHTDPGRIVLRSPAPGDRVGSRKVSDILIDAKVPRPLRPLVGIVTDDTGALAVVGDVRRRGEPGSDVVVDVDRIGRTWTSEMAWIDR